MMGKKLKHTDLQIPRDRHCQCCNINNYYPRHPKALSSPSAATVAHCSIIIQGSQHSTVTVHHHYGGLSPQESNIINAYRALDSSRKAAVRAFMQGLTDEAR